jgi:lipopolysaccharide export LptBFGC system permease protein LptF
MKKTNTLYTLKEILPIFFIGLMTFTIILLMDKIVKLKALHDSLHLHRFLP